MKEKFIPHYQIIGQNVRELRLKQGLTQLELANRCSINREEVSRIENARRDYMHSTLLEVCEGLGISVVDVMKPMNY